MKIAFAPGLLLVLLFGFFIFQVVGQDDSVETASDATIGAEPEALASAEVDDDDQVASTENEASENERSQFEDLLSEDAVPILGGAEFESDYPFASANVIDSTTTDDDSTEEEATASTAATTATPSTATPTAGGGGGGGRGGGGGGGSTTTASAPAPSAAAQPVRITAPTCGTLGAASTRTAPFTGLSASIPAGLPAVVVKVSNNSSASRAALIGLDEADIVFEERIEASATRFFSIFHSSLPENVGPVRSGRTTDIQLAQNLRNPVFGYSGSNEGVARQLQFAADNNLMTLFRNNDSTPFARDSRFTAPDNLFVSPAGLGSCGNGNPVPIFTYGAANSGTAQAASSVSLSARSSYRFDWNGSTWTRSQSGFQHTTRDGSPLAPDNVVIMFVPYVPSVIDAQSVDAETIGSGDAWILRDGTATIGRYDRERGGFGYTFLDGNGSPMNLAPGQTWVVLAPEGSASLG